jgi:hypothetical protein
LSDTGPLRNSEANGSGGQSALGDYTRPNAENCFIFLYARDLRSPADGNPSVFVDRKNQMTTSTYDGLDRLTQVQFNDLSTIN